MTFDQAIVRERMARHWSQEALAFDLGVNQSTYAKWEAGKTEPKISHAIRLAAALGIDLNDIEARGV